MKRKTLFSLFAASVFFGACLYYCHHLHALYAEAKKLENVLCEKNLLVKKIETLRARYPDIELAAQAEAAANKRWRQKLPDRIEADNFIESLRLMAQKNNLSLTSINTSPADDKLSLIIRLELNGNFLSFLAFLKDLESAPRFNESDHFQIEKIDDELHFSLATRIFSLGEDAPKNTFAKEPSFSI